MKKLILSLILSAGCLCAYGMTDENTLHPFRKNGKWGFKDRFDNVVISPSYDGCRDFHEGLAAVMVDGKWGVINEAGVSVVDFSYDRIDDFSEGYVYAVKDSVSYYINEYGAPQQLKDGYTYGRFSDGLASVSDHRTGKWGYMDVKGRIVIDPIYDEVSDFSNEIARVVYKGKERYIRPSGSTTRKGAEEFRDVPVAAGRIYIADDASDADEGEPLASAVEPAPVVSASVAVPVQTEVVEASALRSNLSELLQGMPMVSEADPDKYALIIGNEDYNTYKQEAVYEQNVDYAVADAETFKEYAVNYIGVPESNVILLKNAQKYQMNRGLNKLVDQSLSNPGKRELYVFYAGHGVHDEISRYTYLLPVDVSGNTPEDGIKLDDVYSKLASGQAKRVMVFMDACYSGKGRGIIIKPREPVIKGNMVVFTATSATQKSMPYQEKKHGLFTYFLLKTIKENGAGISVTDLYQSVKVDVESSSTWINDSKQSPELISGQGIDTGWEEWTLD